MYQSVGILKNKFSDALVTAMIALIGSIAAEPIGQPFQAEDGNFLWAYGVTGLVGQTVYDGDTDTAIAVDSSHTAILTAAAAGAYTLDAPARDGLTLRIIGATDYAHVVTVANATVLNGSGDANDTLTWAADAGGVITLESYDGNWYLVAASNVTPSVAA